MKKYLLSILLLVFFSFTFTGGPPQGWYQQFMPDLGGRQISDMFFLDSLTGWAVTAYIDTDDTAYVVKTTNGGDNWQITHTRTGGVGFKRVYFLNSLTGFASGANDFNSYSGLSKSTDGGINWISLNIPDPFVQFDDMYVLGEDTIWLTASSSITGGVFRTTNGGINWLQQGSFGSQNPTKIYMIDANTGFISYSSNTALRRTTNGGFNWTQITGENGFKKMVFVDTLTGWKNSTSGGTMKKTTDGGLSWMQQVLPSGGNIIVSGIFDFTVVSKDTIWGVGGIYLFPNNQARGIIYTTIDGGKNWGYQIPDTTIQISQYNYIDFINHTTGWAYRTSPTGIHTVTGSISSIEQLSSNIPENFKLHQNYPNPFNPATIINYELRIKSEVKLTVYDISGKEVSILVNQTQNPGTYQYTFNASGLTSEYIFINYKLKILHQQRKWF